MHGTAALVTAPAQSLEDAHEIVGRLTQAGFARNSIDVKRQGDTDFEVSVHVRENNRARAEHAIQNRWGTLAALRPSPMSLLMIVGGATALGAGLLAAQSANALPNAVSRLLGRRHSHQ